MNKINLTAILSLLHLSKTRLNIMRLPLYVFIAFSLTVFLSSCITQQSFQELEAVRDYYKSEAESVDSISFANQELVDVNRELELELKQTVRELEELAVANNSLTRNYEEILEKYNRVVQQGESELTAYSYEKIRLAGTIGFSADRAGSKRQGPGYHGIRIVSKRKPTSSG